MISQKRRSSRTCVAFSEVKRLTRAVCCSDTRRMPATAAQQRLQQDRATSGHKGGGNSPDGWQKTNSVMGKNGKFESQNKREPAKTNTSRYEPNEDEACTGHSSSSAHLYLPPHHSAASALMWTTAPAACPGGLEYVRWPWCCESERDN